MCSFLTTGTPPVMPYRRWQPLTQLGQRLGAMSNCRAIQYEESRSSRNAALISTNPAGPSVCPRPRAAHPFLIIIIIVATATLIRRWRYVQPASKHAGVRTPKRHAWGSFGATRECYRRCKPTKNMIKYEADDKEPSHVVSAFRHGATHPS